MRNLLILLTGLLLFSLLGYFCIYKNHARSIQNAIHDRNNALLQSEIPDASTDNIDGHDADLTGNVTTPALKNRADNIERSVGSNVMADKMAIGSDSQLSSKLPAQKTSKASLVEPVISMPKADITDDTKVPVTKVIDESLDSAAVNDLPYRFIATLSEKKKITLKGDVPSKDAHKQVVDLANTLFTGSEVVDELVLSEKASKDWLITVRSMLTNLALLESGSAELVDDIMSMTGKAKTQQIKEKVTIDVSKQMSDLHQGLFNITALDEVQTASNPLAQHKESMTCQQQFKQLLSGNPIHFRLSRAVVSADSMKVLASLANIAKSCPEENIQIEGHTDSTGSETHNKWLSQSRANAVLQQLVKLGVDKTRLSAVGYGDSKPIANNATAPGRAKNRRIEFTVQEVK